MKRRLALIFIFLISLSFIAENVRAEQVEYLSFEGFSLTADTEAESVTFGATEDGIWKTVKTIIVSLPNKKYLAGFRVKWHVYVANDDDGYYEGASHKLRVNVNGNTVWTSTADTTNEGNTEYYDVSQEVFGVFNDTFTIIIEAYQNSIYVDDNVYVTVDAVYLYYLNDNYGIKSKLIELKYIPPGAEDTPQGLLLNKTEIHLNQTYNLLEGALKFWLKWDGSTNIKIFDNLGIDSNGYIYVKDSEGNVYTLEGVTPPIGQYVQVAFAWKNGYGYILLNSSIVKLNWQGDFTISKIGDVNTETGVIIDELLIYNSFISEDYILQVEGQESFSININGKLIKVYPDGGVHLPAPTTVSFYDTNDTLLTYYDWYGSNEVYDAPNGTYKIILSAGGASSVYIVNALDSDIAFLSSDAQGVIEDISIIPNEHGTLVIKNTKGQIIYADSAKQTNTVLGTMGGSYYIKFTDTSNVTRAAGWFTFSGGGITLLLSSSIKEAKGLYADAWWDNGTLKVEFVDDLNATNSWNMTVTYYKQGGVISSFKLTETSKHYIGSFIPPSDADYAFVEIKADNGFKKKVGVYLTYGTQAIPESIFPSWLLFGIFGIGGLLIAPARFRFVSPLIAVFILGFAKLAGLFNTPAWLLSSLTGLAILSLIIYRPSSRGGVI